MFIERIKLFLVPPEEPEPSRNSLLAELTAAKFFVGIEKLDLKEI